MNREIDERNQRGMDLVSMSLEYLANTAEWEGLNFDKKKTDFSYLFDKVTEVKMVFHGIGGLRLRHNKMDLMPGLQLALNCEKILEEIRK